MPTYRYHSPLPHIGTRSSYYNGSRLCSPDAVFILSPLLLVSVRDTACMYSTSDRMHLCYRFGGEVGSEVVPVIRNKVSGNILQGRGLLGKTHCEGRRQETKAWRRHIGYTMKLMYAISSISPKDFVFLFYFFPPGSTSSPYVTLTACLLLARKVSCMTIRRSY